MGNGIYVRCLYYPQYNSCMTDYSPCETAGANQTAGASYACENITSMVMRGDVMPAAMCSFVIPLGGDETGTVWVVGLFVLAMTLISFVVSRSVWVTGFVGMLWITLTFTLLPTFFQTTLEVVLLAIIAAILAAPFINDRLTARGR
jgi:hypothetical protein